MVESIHKFILYIHIPFGFLSLVLFWIPVGVKKGGKLHRKVGWYYFICMWIVLISAMALSVCNILLAKYIAAAFLGYLAIITAYPLWYSYEILNQNKVWTKRYFQIRKVYSMVFFLAGLAMVYLGAIQFNFQGMGPMIAFFGLVGIGSIREYLMTKEKAENKETKLKMHIQGTIISGIAAYTAFLAFGGNQILMQVFQLDQRWMILPWIAPTILGVMYMRFMKRKYRA